MASKQQQSALHGWAHTLSCHPTARQQLESALRPLLTEEVRHPFSTLALLQHCLSVLKCSPFGAELQIPRVFSLEFFTPEFCGMLVEQLDAYNRSGLHISRPNTQNDLGNILSDIGLSRLCDDIVCDVLQPLGALLYDDHGGASLNSHHSFTVVYRPQDFKGLPMHYDRGSNVTLNVSIGKVFTGGECSLLITSGPRMLKLTRDRFSHVLRGERRR